MPEGTANTVTINLGGQAHVGELPRVPVRFLLQRAQREALGFTPADMRAVLELKKGDEPVTPSEEPDTYGLQCVFYAAVGLCHPSPTWGTLREHRHDVMAYGEEVFDSLFRSEKSAELASELVREGRRLLRAMVRDATSILTEEIEAEKDFSEGRAEVSTSV